MILYRQRNIQISKIMVGTYIEYHASSDKK